MADIKFHCNDVGDFRHGYLVRAFSFKENSIEMHNHDFYEVNIILSGTGTHCIENSRLAVRRGDVFLIPPLVAHAYYETDHLEVYHLLMKKDCFYICHRRSCCSWRRIWLLWKIVPMTGKNAVP